MKGTGAKRNVCPGSCVSTGARFPVAPVESASMGLTIVLSEVAAADGVALPGSTLLFSLGSISLVLGTFDLV